MAGDEDLGPQESSLEEVAQEFEQLEILELLPQGGMGLVYKARQRGLDRLVALKVLPPTLRDNPAFSSRFQREARAMARLAHPNVVPIYDFGIRNERYYFVMEYVDGLNLRQFIARQPLSPDDAIQLVREICEGLQYAHSHGVIHRDIKPENILVDSCGRVRIADFGLAKVAEANEPGLTEIGDVMGTVRYMAPEQLETPASVDHRADIYSVGLILYELLTGSLPVLFFEPPSQKVRVNSKVDAIVSRALQREPEKRYSTAAEMKADLDELVKLGPGASRPASAQIPEAAANPTGDRNLLRRMSLLVAAIVLVAGAFLYLTPAGKNLPGRAGQPIPADAKQGEASATTKSGSGQESLPPTAPRAGQVYPQLLTRGVVLEMVWVPGGSFTIGSPDSEPARSADEGPQSRIDTPGFWIGKYEVSKEQYNVVMGTHLIPPKQPMGSGKDAKGMLTWTRAMRFCIVLSQKTGIRYSLPTEAQWEYACRAGSGEPYCFGSDAATLAAYAAYKDSSSKSELIGMRKANAFGLYDMHGNVAEWCRSLYRPYPYQDGDGRNDELSSGNRVFRGGSFNSPAQQCRSASRASFPPEHIQRSIGMRLVIVPENPRLPGDGG